MTPTASAPKKKLHRYSAMQMAAIKQKDAHNKVTRPFQLSNVYHLNSKQIRLLQNFMSFCVTNYRDLQEKNVF